MIPEKHMAMRLQMTTSQPVKLSISNNTPNLNKNTAEVERLYPPNSLKNLRTEASGRFRVLPFQTKKYEIVKLTATAHWNEMSGDIIYSPQYPLVNTRSDKSQSTSVSTTEPTALVPANLAYLIRSFGIC